MGVGGGFVAIEPGGERIFVVLRGSPLVLGSPCRPPGSGSGPSLASAGVFGSPSLLCPTSFGTVYYAARRSANLGSGSRQLVDGYLAVYVRPGCLLVLLDPWRAWTFCLVTYRPLASPCSTFEASFRRRNNCLTRSYCEINAILMR